MEYWNESGDEEDEDSDGEDEVGGDDDADEQLGSKVTGKGDASHGERDDRVDRAAAYAEDVCMEGEC